MIQRDLEMALHAAVQEAQRRRHEYITLEHLLYALCFDDTSAKIMRHSGIKVDRLKRDLESFLDDDIEAVPGQAHVDSLQTMAFQRVMQRAIFHVQSSGKDEVDGGNILVAIFSETDSHAVYFMMEQGVERLDVVSYISHGVSKLKVTSGKKDGGGGNGEGNWSDPDSDMDDDSFDENNPLEAFCKNLVERATQGKIDPLIGRHAEVERTVQILCRRRKQPHLRGRPRRGQDRAGRRARPSHQRGRGPRTS